ncbi:Nn.00g102540.m01.CDS01 [Neocucurbitaria sp. VM-36]
MPPKLAEQSRLYLPGLGTPSESISHRHTGLIDLRSDMNGPAVDTPTTRHFPPPRCPPFVSQNPISTPSSILPSNCIVCSKFNRILPCCADVGGPCSLCADFDHLLRSELDRLNTFHQDAYEKLNQEIRQEVDQQARLQLQQMDQQLRNKFQRESKQYLQYSLYNLQQEKEDHVDSLKQQTLEAEEEGKKLDRVLEERKGVLRGLEREKKMKEPAVEFTVREGRKKGPKGKGKKKGQIE